MEWNPRYSSWPVRSVSSIRRRHDLFELPSLSSARITGLKEDIDHNHSEFAGFLAWIPYPIILYAKSVCKVGCIGAGRGGERRSGEDARRNGGVEKKRRDSLRGSMIKWIMALAGNRAIARSVIVTVFLACCTRAFVIYVSSSREKPAAVRSELLSNHVIIDKVLGCVRAWRLDS